MIIMLGSDFLQPENLEVNQTAVTASSFSVLVQIVSYTTIQLLTISYIATDPNFPHHLNSFDNVPINSSGPLVKNIIYLRLTLLHGQDNLNTMKIISIIPHRQLGWILLLFQIL